MKPFTPSEIRKMGGQLAKNLSPEYLSIRSGSGNQRLTYVEGWLVINLANQIFGFDGWSTKMKDFTLEYCDAHDGRFDVGYSCTCRVTLRDGTYKEDTGFGSADNQRQKGVALQKARKEAATDALKRALRQFGNALGNCCYDKEYLRNVTKMNKKREKMQLELKDLLKRSDFENCSQNCSSGKSLDKNIVDKIPKNSNSKNVVENKSFSYSASLNSVFEDLNISIAELEENMRFN